MEVQYVITARNHRLHLANPCCRTDSFTTRDVGGGAIKKVLNILFAKKSVSAAFASSELTHTESMA
ncbi:MAG: hypothetical protein ACI8PB_004578 [Desulforhopalus sp.]|jgi:hypothetical protein